MEDKITIIEGPTPEFETIDDGWAMGLNESPALYDLALTHVRTYNGPALVERCHRAWHSRSSIFLHYRDQIGMEDRVPILAARSLETDDGQVLLLWVRRQHEEVEIEIDLDDDDNDDDEFDV